MRHVARTAALLALATAAACADKPNGVEAGELTGVLNGQPWRASAAVRPGPADGPTLHAESKTGRTRRTIQLDLVSEAPGSYPVAGRLRFFSGPTYGDEMMLEADSGTLVITRAMGGTLHGSLAFRAVGPGGAVVRLQNGGFVAPSRMDLW